MSELSSLSSLGLYPLDVGVGVGAVEPIPMTGRGGAMVMRSLSVFLTYGRKARSGLEKDRGNSADSYCEDQILKSMPEGPNGRNAVPSAKLFEYLKRRTKFSRSELEALCKIYKKLTTGQQFGASSTTGDISAPVQGIDRAIFRELLHNTFDILTEDMIVERMFCCWDKDNDGFVSLESWIFGLNVFLRGTLREKTEFCFKVYDLNNDGFISKDEIFQFFKDCLIKQPGDEDPEEGVRDLSEMVLKKLDVDRDGKVSFRDYETAIKKEPLLLEAFGTCLPTQENCTAFLTTLQT
ncbi:EF-hand calcium-binding domain-containing protein 1 [Orussus abietinus]|uniref:EF-hand calcium-binding domain-containing protein 1 n=1 Tax=Orussus abietinus TaxID=222816 RepID=UPI000626E933|nr:EF-hand calcium-binding domain-containing protein 1 [Orussus abietinus]